MSKNQLNYDEIRDQHLDTMLKLAFKHADALEAQDIMKESDTVECPVSEERAEATYKMFLDKLAKQEVEEKRNARIVQFRRSIPRIIQIAACLVLVMGIVTPFAVANVESIRVKVMELLISIQEDHTERSFVENESAAFDVPADCKELTTRPIFRMNSVSLSWDGSTVIFDMKMDREHILISLNTLQMTL